MRFKETRPGRDVTFVTNATSEHIKVGTALARACTVFVWPNLGPLNRNKNNEKRIRGSKDMSLFFEMFSYDYVCKLFAFRLIKQRVESSYTPRELVLAGSANPKDILPTSGEREGLKFDPRM